MTVRMTPKQHVRAEQSEREYLDHLVQVLGSTPRAQHLATMDNVDRLLDAAEDATRQR